MSTYWNNVRFAESFLERYGDNWRGVGWTKREEDAQRRYEVMLEVIRNEDETIDLLDFGCGASHLLEHIRSSDLKRINYTGLDLSPRFLALSRAKFPDVTYHELDVLESPEKLPHFDYIIMNGIFNSRWKIGLEEMTTYFQQLVSELFQHARVGLAFNVMSKLVDWEREDLFHLPFDELGRFLSRDVSRHFVVRHDYGLYEYTVYVYREP